MSIGESYNQLNEVDVIGDLHGCYYEMIDLIEKMNYKENDKGLYEHPEGKKLVFVGDLTDRGPENKKCLEFAYKHTQAGLSYCVQGNHCNKLYRTLKGNPTKVSSGLQKTLDELENVSEYRREKYWKWLRDLPLFLKLDGGDLLVCHAAPPKNSWNKGKIKSTCLYGHTTGKTTEHGYPERQEWHQSWNKSDEGTFVVYGHVTHREVKMTDKTVCLDTACYGGNKLSAMRWPSKEILSVESYQEGRGINFADDRDRPRTDVYGDTPDPEKIDDLNLNLLLDKLESEEGDILWLIDHDDELKRREHDNGLVIANASKSLYTPNHVHQLYAKGIVYKRHPYRLVSLPLTKMYNHTRNEVSDDLSNQLEDKEEIDFEWVEKVDGAMIQLFEHEGETFFTTRSVLEGTHFDILESEGFSYVEESREIAEDKYPQLTNPSFVKGKTFIFELLHPEGDEGVTDYGEREDLVLLSVYDQYENRYWTNEEVLEFADQHNLETFDILLEENDLSRGVDRVLDKLEDDPSIPEGAVLCFENDEEILHRVKIKTKTWLRRFKLKFECSYKNTVNMLWNKPELWEWDKFLEFLREEGLTEEEVEDFYKDHFEKFLGWVDKIQSQKEQVETLLEKFYEENGTMEESDLDESAYNKELALHFQEEEPDLFHIIMGEHRKGLDLKDHMKYTPAHKGLKGVITEWENEEDEKEIEWPE